MKTLTTTIISLIAVAFFLTSCKGNENKQGAATINPTITISQGNGNCKLILSGDVSGNGTTKTNGNNLVTWERGTGVNEIVDIYKKSGDDVFQVEPKRKHPNDPQSDWFAITKNTKDKLTENYSIKWKNADDNICILDPSVKINQ